VVPRLVASLLLLLSGVWWILTLLAVTIWESRFTSPRRYGAKEGAAGERRNWRSALNDAIGFGLPPVLSIGLGLDGLLAGGTVLYAPGFSFFLPFTEAFQFGGTAVLLVGLVLFTWSGYLLSRYVLSQPPEERPILQRGPYWYVRHPFYLSGGLVGAGLLLLAQNVVLLPLLILFAALRYPKSEEAELLHQYGDAYREYQARTGRFLPRFRRR
jgi:protein-S-isoprenylcysteine O-methyltransferase Ste14